jgi:hypothetical protein
LFTSVDECRPLAWRFECYKEKEQGPTTDAEYFDA